MNYLLNRKSVCHYFYFCIGWLLSLLVFEASFLNALSNSSLQNQRQGSASPAKWLAYRDARHQFGLAVPSHWTVYPTPTIGSFASATFMNYQPPVDETIEAWPAGAAKIQADVYSLPPNSNLETWLLRQSETRALQMVSIQKNLEHPHQPMQIVLKDAQAKTQTLYLFRMPNRRILQLSAQPEIAWLLPEARHLLRSVVLSRQETIALPSETPAPLFEFDATAVFGHPETDLQEIHPCDWGNEVANSPIPLHLPFKSGTRWQVGGVGYYYGDVTHSNDNNDYYATDWNLVGANDFGQPVFPVAPGKVVVALHRTTGYGNRVAVQHPNGVTTLYAHLSAISVAKGDSVSANTQIGAVGSTGNSTGPHLHLSFRVNGASRYFDSRSRRPSPMMVHTAAGPRLWPLCDGQTRVTASKQFFEDIADDYWAKPWIDAVYAAGLMEPLPQENSNARFFYPKERVTRAELAEVWVKGLHGADFVPPAASGAIFDDVPVKHPAADWIEQLAADSLTVGCAQNPPRFCPDDSLTRAEMARFILLALHGRDYQPPAASEQIFGDVPLAHPQVNWINQLLQEGIALGCATAPRLFCPQRYLTREETAILALRAFDIYPKNRQGSDITLAVAAQHALPQPAKQFALLQNYPNPFNPTTTITYSLNKPTFVSLKVYDLLGREVATLVHQRQAAGRYSVDFMAENLASGIYLYRMQAGSSLQTKKMLLMR